MRTAAPAVLCALILAVAGCNSGDDAGDSDTSAARTAPERTKPSRHGPGRGVRSDEGRVIRGWLLALERADYDQAAYYFAPGAIIDQGDPFRLKNESDARSFNASLPCRADLVELEDEGKTVLASFTLRRGPGGPCTGIVKVRYTIRKGKFTEWRQLPSPDSEDSEQAPGQPI